MSTVQHLISGQSQDLALEDDRDATLDDVLAHGGRQDGGADLRARPRSARCAAGAGDDVAGPLAEYGRLVGLAFQLVDDVLGIVGDPQVTGKSASSDLRAGKRSIPVVAALQSGTAAGRELAVLLDAGPLTSEEQIAHAARLVEDAGGIAWANSEARRLVAAASDALDGAPRGLPQHAAEQFEGMSSYLVRRAGSRCA